MAASYGGWWLETAEAAGAVFTDSLAGDAVIRTAPGYRLLLGAGSNVASAAQVTAAGVAAPLVAAARFQDVGRGYSDLGGNVTDLYDRAARLATGELIQAGAVALGSKVSGVLPVANGGTGGGSWPVAGGILYASSSNVLASSSNLFFSGTTLSAGRFADLGRGHPDLGSNVSDLYSRLTAVASGASLGAGAVALASNVSGVLPVANGGTGAASWSPEALLFADAAGGALRSSAALRFGGDGLLLCDGGLGLGAAPGTRYVLHVDPSSSNLKLSAVNSAGGSNLYIDFGEVRALLAGLRVGP